MISHDWKELCDYYNMAFKSSYFGKMKDHSGKFKESVIGIDGVHVVGYHILIPGFHKSYPTLEIFTYSIKGREKPCNDDSLGINAVGYVSDNYGADLDVLSVAGGSFIKKEKKFIKAKDIQDNIIYTQKSQFLLTFSNYLCLFLISSFNNLTNSSLVTLTVSLLPKHL